MRSKSRALALAGAILALGLGACGGDDEQEAGVGSCIDGADQVVDCASSEAEFELTSDQDAPDAIACIVIDDPPEVEVEVGGGNYCAKPLE